MAEPESAEFSFGTSGDFSFGIYNVRNHLIGLYGRRDAEDRHPGEAVSIVNAEVNHLGGFAGQAPSQAFANIAMLVGMLGYMNRPGFAGGWFV